MQAHAAVEYAASRFASLLEEAGRHRAIYDEVLLETHGCVVTPTLGSILPNWLLVIPRTPAINFAWWQAASGTQACDLVQSILAKHNICGKRVIWFEHGPSEAGSSVGCGVDQAHLHIVVDAPFSFQDFVVEAAKTSQLTWHNRSARIALQSVNPLASYLVAASMDRAVIAQNVESVGSQFFRRLIATLIQRPDVWNYRTHPHLDNVRETIRAFSTQIT